MIVDSHCHVSNRWYEPVESLLFQMDRHGVERAVLVQMLGQTDNSYQQDCATRYPDRFSSVVLVDAAAPDACAHVRALAEAGAAGIRLRPNARSPGDDPLAIWREADSASLAVSCVGSAAAFASADFAALLETMPGLPVVLEHLGGASRPDADEEERALRRRVFDLSIYPNLYLKLPGLGELAPRRPQQGNEPPFDPAVPSVLMDALASFGPSRLMWGSDYPPVSSREGYGNALHWMRAAVDHLPIKAQDAMFGDVATDIFFGRTRP